MVIDEAIYLSNLLKLMEENPGLPVLPMVHSEIVGDDGYAYWMGAWERSSKEEYILTNEGVRFRDDGGNDLGEMMTTVSQYDPWWENSIVDLDEAEQDKLLKEKYDSLPWKKAIIVYIGLPKGNGEK